MAAHLDNDAFKAHLTSLEDQTWKALCSSGSALLPFLAESCTMLFPGGMVLAADTTPSLVDTLQSPMFQPWSEYSLHDVRVIKLGDDAGVICYRIKAQRAVSPSAAPAREGAAAEGGEERVEGRTDGNSGQGQEGHETPAEPPTEPIEYEALISSTWLRVPTQSTGSSNSNSDGQEWKMASHHQTPVA